MSDKNRKNSQLQSLVNSFYYNEFWEFLKCEKFDQAIADELFDTAVNQGRMTAAKYLQESLNLLNNNQRHYKDIAVDGEIGDVTINAYNNYMSTSVFPNRSKEKNINTLLKVLNGLQFERYKDIVKRSPDQEIYFYGWLQRVKKDEKNIKIPKGKNLGPTEREQAGHRHNPLAGREGNRSISSEHNESFSGGPNTNSWISDDGSRRSSLTGKKRYNKESIRIHNKTEKEVNSLINFWLKINIKLNSIINFFNPQKS
jgi:hypothetical protein